jgi:hypothetical protein
MLVATSDGKVRLCVYTQLTFEFRKKAFQVLYDIESRKLH